LQQHPTVGPRLPLLQPWHLAQQQQQQQWYPMQGSCRRLQV
jgi:hypothetical protein